ncbi:MAG TPA: ribokinase, partial [Candidatus Latescibacteria bacterium]|nr:ribokinase [Candidatus Latescibacterota bacterium]
LTQLETPLPTVAFALRTARSIGVRTILNPAPATVLGPELLADVDWITPNETEAARISGIEVQNVSDAEHAANALRRMGARNVVVTMGEAGALLMTDDESLHVPARRVPAVDTVAAGDAFNGAFAVALARNAPPREAVEFACAAASLSVTRRGAQPALPTADEVTKFASQLA